MKSFSVPQLGAYGQPALQGAYRLVRTLLTAARPAAGQLRKAVMESVTNFFRNARSTGPSSAAKRAWLTQMESLGKERVRYLLDQLAVSTGGKMQRCTFIDAGIMHGAHRSPPRSFVDAWAYDEEDEGAKKGWRWAILIVLAIAVAVTYINEIATFLS